MLYQILLRRFLFRLEPERAHRTVFELLKAAQVLPPLKRVLEKLFSYNHPSLECRVLDRAFENPVGLAAGFDKNCEIFDVIPCFGFGFVECGTVTARDQSGNPGPRMFRLPEDDALINRLGFNNKGAIWVESHLSRKKRTRVPVGINIGLSRVTDLDRAADDYLYSFEKLFPYADYFTVNVSSPNTPGLRDLEKNLSPLIGALQKRNREIGGSNGKGRKPLLVKISPDLTPKQIDAVAETCLDQDVSGIVATNTTISREGVRLQSPIEGGLSGRPLLVRSTAVLKQLYKRVGKRLVLIGVGGIFSAGDAYRKIRAGASLVQLYTGWVYGGPSTIGDINRGLVEMLRQDGFRNVQEAVGTDPQ